MTPLSPFVCRTPRPAGAALIVTLLFIALITVMVVGYLDSSRMDHTLASSHLERARADHMAREGLQSVIATLQRETVDPPRREGESMEDYMNRKRHWSSQPGALIVPDDPPAGQKQLRRLVPLSSGASAAASYPAQVFEPVNLNIPLLGERNTSSHLITDRLDPATGNVVEMKLKWIYVRADPGNNGYTYDTDEVPDLSDAARPIIGRFAYWTDDEGAKINYNLAWKRNPAGAATPNANPSSHPSQINLMALNLADGSRLPESMANALRQWTTATPGRYFNSFADARQLEPSHPGITGFLAYNKFELTHYNHDPDTTFFGEDRILLTTNRDLVPRNPDGSYARKFLDILRDDSADGRTYQQRDPAVFEDLQSGQPDWRSDPSGNTRVPGPNKFNDVVQNLIRYLNATNWPFSPGRSFRDKYYPGSPVSDARMGQIAVNIIEYVRAKESAQPVIAPLRFSLDANGKYVIGIGTADAQSLQGVSRGPLITEMGVYVEKDPVDPPPPPYHLTWPRESNGAYKKLYRVHFKTELHLPANYGLEDIGIDLVPDKTPNPGANSLGWFIGIPAASSAGYLFPSPNGKLINMGSKNDPVRVFESDVEGPDGTLLKAGRYVTVTKTYYRDIPWDKQKTIPNNRLGLYQDSLGDADHVILGKLGRWPRVCVVTQQGGLPCAMSDPATTSIEHMQSLEVDDPRCGMHPSDWKAATVNSFGRVNTHCSVGQAASSTLPQQDTDANGAISDHSLYMPPPKGVGANGAEGDNGRLTSVGELGYIHTGVNARTGSTSWRTIRLQPNRYPDANTLPDWALLDLFSVPNTGAGGSDALYKPHGTAVGGRLNVNSHVSPFESMTRDRGLAALFTGAKGLSGSAEAETIARNIYNRVLASGTNRGKHYGYPWPARPRDPLPAEAPNAYDTPGEICEIAGVADQGEAGEDLVREIVSLISSRSSVFTIYTVGQALKQTRTGDLTVTSEQRHQVMVERVHHNRGTPEPDDDQVQFRTRYFRNLTP